MRYTVVVEKWGGPMKLSFWHPDLPGAWRYPWESQERWPFYWWRAVRGGAGLSAVQEATS